MSAPGLTLILPGGDPDLLDATIESIRLEAGEQTLILGLAGPGLTAERIASAGIEVADPDSVASPGEIVAFARAGDRLIPGALEMRLLTFTNFPEAGISMAGHVLIGPGGEVVRRVSAPQPTARADEIIIRRSLEAAAVLVRAETLDRARLDLLARPLGDIVVWSRIAQEAGRHVSGEYAAEIRLDPERHGQSGVARIGALVEAVGSAADGDEPGDSTLRRELLRRLYLAPEADADPIDLSSLFAGKLDSPEGAAEVVADLQWIAERQSEALQLERLRWTEGELRPEDVTPLTVSEEILEAQAKLTESGARMSQLSHIIEMLNAEVYRRDGIISELHKVSLAEARAIADGDPDGEDRR